MPSFTDVVLQLNCNGTDASTSFPDSSASSHSVTATGNAQVDTAQSKYGGASLLLDGTGDYLTIASSSAFGFGTGPWTAEAHIRPSSSQTNQFGVFDFRPGITSAHATLYITAGRKLTYYDGSTVRGDTGSAVASNTWSHIAWAYDGTTLRAFIDGVQQWSSTFTPNFSTARPLVIGASYLGTIALNGHIDNIRISSACWYTSNFTPPTGEFEYEPPPDPIDGYIEVDGPLGEPALLGMATVSGYVEDAGPLGSPTVSGYVQPAGVVAVASPLGDPAVLGLHDFTGQLDPSTPNFYVMDLDTPGGLVRVPVSSWQATLQVDEACYVQCVVPACAEWVEDLGDATEFVIWRQVVHEGTTIEYEMARAPLQTLSLAQGPTNYSATLSGYTDALTADEDPPAVYDRDLTGIRAVFITGANTRARTSIDWLLRPGHRAFVNETEIIVDFISYYVGQGDAYMDVGERA